MPDWFLALDHGVLRLFNQWVGHSPEFDRILWHLAGNHLVKGVVPMMFAWGLWFLALPPQVMARQKLIATGAIAVVAIAIGRFAAQNLPYRDRPIHTAGLDIVFAEGVNEEVLRGWSSMPSDHAAMYFALATCLFLIHRGVGIAALLHAAVVICLPRIYFALHYPTDIAAGALIGIATALLLLAPLTRLVERANVMGWEAASPHTFYPVLFLLSFQIASMFTHAIALLKVIL